MTEKTAGFYSSEIDGTPPDERTWPQDESPRSARAQLANCPIIAAVNSTDVFDVALNSPTRTIYLITGNPLNLPLMLRTAHERGKTCLVNIDFIDGLSRDRFAVEWLAQQGVDGVVSTKAEALKAARTLGLITVQRTFAIDSAAVTATLRSLSQFQPEAVEILPAAVAPRVARKLHEVFPNLAIIGGGLVESVHEIENLLKAGVRSVSVSDPRLWLI